MINAVLTIAATLLTSPTNREVLREFYRKVVPMGVWGPIAREVQANHFILGEKKRWSRDVASVLIGIPWIMALYMIPIYWVAGMTSHLKITTLLAVGTSVLLYFTWYRNLPED